MYKEIIGVTAVRKSSKIKAIQEEFTKRLPDISYPDYFVNYTYFLIRLLNFDIG